jgi:acyl dehydratase
MSTPPVQLVVNHPSELLNTVGQTMGPTPLMVIDQQRIDQFAEATGDHQWIHVDPVRAADGPFGATVAHGYLTLSLANLFLPQLLQVNNVSMGVNYGADGIRFPNVVRVGSRISGRGEVISAEPHKTGAKLVVRITIEVEGEQRPACIVDTISLFYP